MVHNLTSEGHRRRRKRSKKPSYSASSEELASNNKVQVREQVAVYSQQPTNNSTCTSLLPDGFEAALYQLLGNEMAYQPRTDYLFNAVCEDKVDARMRDEAVFNLRFLHKFHNLAPDCFAHAVNITDRFLARVKVKPKYMACLATAAYLIAAKMIEPQENWPTPEKLVRMSRCGGSPSDLSRMEAIIRAKLRAGYPTGLDASSPVAAGGLEAAVTPLHFLSLLGPLFASAPPGRYERAVGLLETCLCSVAVYAFRPALLALCVARRYLGGGRGEEAEALERVAHLLGLTISDLTHCDAALDAVGDLRAVRSGGGGGSSGDRRRLATACPRTSASWPGLRRLRPLSRRHLPPASALQRQRQQQQQQQQQAAQLMHHSQGSCSGLDTIAEELLDDDCLPDISQLFHTCDFLL